MFISNLTAPGTSCYPLLLVDSACLLTQAWLNFSLCSCRKADVDTLTVHSTCGAFIIFIPAPLLVIRVHFFALVTFYCCFELVRVIPWWSSWEDLVSFWLIRGEITDLRLKAGKYAELPDFDLVPSLLDITAVLAIVLRLIDSRNPPAPRGNFGGMTKGCRGEMFEQFWKGFGEALQFQSQDLNFQADGWFWREFS